MSCKTTEVAQLAGHTHPQLPMCFLPTRLWSWRWNLRSIESLKGKGTCDEPNEESTTDMDALPMNQWIGLRENLKETLGFPIRYGVFL